MHPEQQGLWARITDILGRWRLAILPLALLAAGASATSLPQLSISTDPASGLPAEDPSVQAWISLSERFGAFDTLLVGLQEPGGGISAAGLRALDEVTRQLNDRKELGVRQARSLSNMTVSQRSDDGLMSLGPALDPAQIPEDPEALRALGARLAADPSLRGSFISTGGNAYLVVVQLDPEVAPADVASGIRSVVDAAAGPLDAFFFGAPFAADAVTGTLRDRAGRIALAGLLLFLAPLVLLLRRFSLALLVLPSAAAALLFWFGLLELVGLPLDSATGLAAFPVAAVSLALFARIGGDLMAGSSGTWTGRLCARGLLLLAGAGTVIAVSSLVVPSPARGFVLATALGMAAAFAATLLVLTPALSWLRPGPPGPARRGRRPRALLVILAGAAVFVAGFLGATQIRFRSLPRNLFFQEDPMGRALGFLDTRFGGADLLQIGVRGDFSDPRDASHLLRLTDCLEGTGAFSDVRSVGQVLALLGKGFFGLYRVPREPEALAQLWSFLEGNEDIRALVTEDRDEAMIAARIHPSRMGDLEGLLLAARAAESCALGEPREVAQARLDALRRRYLPARPPGSVQASLDVLEAPPPPSGMFREALLVRLRGYMASPESAFAPSEPEWEAMAEVLASDGDVTGRLARTIEGLAGFRSMGYPQEVATRVAADLLALSGEAERTRVIDLALAELAGTGDPGSPELIDRARGVLADLRDRLPTTKGGRVTISGTPAVAEAVQGPMAIGIVQGAAIIWALLCLVTWAVTRRTRSFIVVSVEVGVATLYTFALGWLLDVQMDPVCAPLYLVPPLVGFFVSPWIHRLDSELCPVGNRQVAAFVLALAGGALGLMLSGVLPMLRVGAVVALGLGLVILSSTFFRRIAA